MKTIGFVGGGRVARILIGGWQHAGLQLGTISVHEPDDQAFGALHTLAPVCRRTTLEEAVATNLVFIALHPPAFSTAAPVIKAAIPPDAIVVSLAPKVTLGSLEGACGTTRVVRIIPNASSLIGQGYNPVTFGPGCDARTKETVLALFAPLGQAPEVAEGLLEAYAILTGMGPAYFWYQWDALRHVVRGLGLEDEDADAALRAMVTGALATLLDSGLPADAVMDLVPGKPLAGQEPAMRTAYLEALPALHAKIHPAAALAGG